MNWSAMLTALLPEHLLLAGLVLVLVAEIASPRSRAPFPIAVAATVAALVAAAALYAAGTTLAPFPGDYSTTPAAYLQKALLAGLVLPVLLISRDEFGRGRYYALVLASLYGASLLTGADSLATLFLAIELLSLPVYALVLLGGPRRGAPEAALKYLVLGGTATATLLMGTALLYGWHGSLSVDGFAAALASAEPRALAGVALVLAALYLKAAIVPLHAWAPDAYEGASIPVAAYMAAVVKAAVLLAALRLFGDATADPALVPLLAALPLASMAWGNLAAMRQTGFRRTLAYSSIAHAGYLYFAFLGVGAERASAVTFYLAAYGAATLLAFAALPRRADDAAQDALDGLRGLFHRRPAAAVLLAAALLSLAGIPPLPGFVAKFVVFRNVVAAGHTTYAVLGLLASYLGIYFYLRIVQYMFMSPEAVPDAADARRHALLASAACAVPIVLLALFPGWLLDAL
jgi:NADH-quinone oxidoreductase subunit N